jgi:exodeoxyribonuclease V alpha subunit
MFFSKDTEDDIKSTIIIIILKLLNDISYYNIQVLTPMRLYNLGSASLNNALQDIVNPKSKDKNEIESRGIIFREKDKVIQIKNNYNLEWSVYDKNKKCIETGTGIFNGDEGIISEINNDYISVLFDGNRIVKYDSANLNELELSYALTIHKAQGSEYEVVIIPIGPGYTKFMSRNLLYTGLTRAKKLAIIVGIKNKIFSMVDNNVSNNDRNSSLMLRMQRLHDNYEQ